MREELLGPKVENVGVAVVNQMGEDNKMVYNVYLLNLTEDIIDEILITSRGYGHNANTGEKIKTSVLRHRIDLLMPNEFAKIEPIIENVFGLSNEYWVSFYKHDKMYDKKFVFVAESISEANLKTIPVIGEKGVMIM
ncbi:MAG: hypothetical protein QNK23_00130 [Crocinitomicaceae bacterium]|nr:hypothetical protein [Crocinitomicaceae bacterium]